MSKEGMNTKCLKQYWKRRPKGRPRTQWLYQIKRDIERTTGVEVRRNGHRQTAGDSFAKVNLRQQRQRKEEEAQ
jgi:hypothetical protein